MSSHFSQGMCTVELKTTGTLSSILAGRSLIDELRSLINIHFGITCHIDLVPPRTLPRTSSGKLSRSKAKQDFLARSQNVVGNVAGAHG